MIRIGRLFNSAKPSRLAVSKRTGFFGAAPAAAALMLVWPFNGMGAKKVSMTPGKEDPAAHGTVAVKSTKNGNTEVDITTKALAQPSALTPPRSTYVVWLQPTGKKAREVGALRVDNKLNGKLDTVIPYRAFKVFITAENEPTPAKPHGPALLSADVLG